ncbi:hypothetical protein O6H91_11G083900 [Diphasiastrum complanatum]|uniref:Uncharacterized protein n=2 Tax=Diphasiastrum complanatum TaxID=34168 RepID=A0ACC2CB44_DIPCM|nr:hypothetical protein O6H91_11G083900 [Diphasiastrum complanatum]KAJ7539262.1 hypothetical protein O6H91_11G083900 [Diphasiastrum complanatum]
MGEIHEITEHHSISSQWQGSHTIESNRINSERNMESFNGFSVSDDEYASEGQLTIWNTIFAFASSMALKAAILLDIPDILARAGPEATLSLEQIFLKLPSKAPKTDYLQRILRFLAVKNIFKETAVDTPSGVKEWRYGLTNASKWLVKENNDFCLAPMAVMQLDKVTQAPWHHFNECVLEGGDAFERANGKDVWNFANEFPSFNNLFNEAMAAESKISISAVLKHYDGFKDLKTLVDVGGGVGLTISKIVTAYPYIKCINFDLPHVVALAPCIPGVEHVGGDMFQSVPSADAIIMKWIMHDWDDERCTKILRNCYRALPEKGKVIIIDVVLDPSEKTDPYTNLRCSFDLVMIAHANGGLERTREEWHKLLTKAGFQSFKIFKIPNLQSVIEVYKT